MEIEAEPQVEGELLKDQTLISKKDMQQALEQKGYGEITNKKIFLKPFESLYLLYCEKLKLKKASKIIDFASLMHACKKYDEGILTKFLIYRDLRNRGYIVKAGFGFGEKGSKYLIFGMNEGTQEKIGQLHKKIEQITHMGKEPIIAVIERRGEIIYYKISRINFLENKEKVSLEPFK